jgi:thiamine pyrophosphokinase
MDTTQNNPSAPCYRHCDGDAFDAVIVAAGSYPAHPLPLTMIGRLRHHILCCDGAADALLAAGLTPRRVVGDGDSITPHARARLADRLTIIDEQDSNDLTKTVRLAVRLGYRRLCITGATGKREDHTLGNISLLADYMDIARVEMWTDHGTFTPSAGNATFASRPGQQVSIFPVEPIPLTTEGLRWPVCNRTLARWWQGTLNESASHAFTLRTTGKVIVFRAY